LLNPRIFISCCRFKAALEIEQQLIIKPNYRTPFRDMEDVLDRLMPYHLFTYPEVTDKPGGMAGFDRASKCFLFLFLFLFLNLKKIIVF